MKEPDMDVADYLISLADDEWAYLEDETRGDCLLMELDEGYVLFSCADDETMWATTVFGGYDSGRIHEFSLDLM